MNYYDIINEAKNIFVTRIYEPDENILEFELTIGRTGGLEDGPIINNVNLGPTRQIFYEDLSDVYRVKFPYYIAYSVLNESYEQLGGSVYTGTKIRIYTESHFLNYVRKDTFATANYPGEFKHYAFITLNHIINVASTVEPDIEKGN